MNNPIDVHFDAHILRLCLGHQQVEQRAVTVWQKLITVRVIEELDSVLRKRFTSAIENRRRLAASLFIERIFVRNPRATGILQAQQLCFARHSFNIVAALFVREVSADGFDLARVELFFELLRHDTVSSGELNVRDAKRAHLVQRLAHIFLELIAEAVKLEADGFLRDAFNSTGPRKSYAAQYK